MTEEVLATVQADAGGPAAGRCDLAGVFAVAQEIAIGQAAALMDRSERRIRRLLAANGASPHAGTRPLRPPTARRQELVVLLNAAQAWSAPSASASSPMSRSMRTQP